MSLWSFQGARGTENAGHEAGLSKLNSVRTANVEVDVVPGEPSDRTADAIDGWAAPGVLLGDVSPRSSGFPRKEVIQPQLPLRLPCYDFTPVTSPTFDGSLQKWLGHRLRVLLTPVV